MPRRLFPGFRLWVVSFCAIHLAQMHSGAAEAPRFSRPTGTFLEDFVLELSVSTPGAVIRFTTNGSVPLESSLVYSDPIAVTNSMQIRARSIEIGAEPSVTASESYVKIDSSLTDFSSDLPVVVVDNFKRGGPPAGVSQPVFFGIFDRTNGTSALTNPPHIATRAGIHLRGSS